MRFQGGKTQISTQISQIITQYLRERERVDFISLFVGAGSIESKVEGYRTKICNDKNEYLIAMYLALQQGWKPPDHITLEQYKYIKEHKNENKALTGFVGFGSSFGGKWFGGYARDKLNKRNYTKESKESLLKDMNGLMDAHFICGDYRQVILPEQCVIYSDSPYANTTSYNGEIFNSSAYWEYMRQISKDHMVFISEQKAPLDFKCIWMKQVTRTLNNRSEDYFKAQEKVFIHECNYDKWVEVTKQ